MPLSQLPAGAHRLRGLRHRPEPAGGPILPSTRGVAAAAPALPRPGEPSGGADVGQQAQPTLRAGHTEAPERPARDGHRRVERSQPLAVPAAAAAAVAIPAAIALPAAAALSLPARGAPVASASSVSRRRRPRLPRGRSRSPDVVAGRSSQQGFRRMRHVFCAVHHRDTQ
eukprot:2509844-Prymnesium_polylepis.1